MAGMGHVAWCGAMWHGVGPCGKVWEHVVGVEAHHKG